jgi:exopolysaccharide biosynthesis polyprenyl glycosylphosphotransferase
MLNEYSALLRRTAIATDLAVLAGAFVLAHALRGALAGVGGLRAVRPLEESLWLLALAGGIWLACLQGFGCYQSLRYQRYRDVLGRLARAHTVSALLLLSAVFVARRWELSRLALQLFLVLAFLGLAARHLALSRWLRHHRREGLNSRRALIVGAADRAARYIQFLREHPYWGVRVIGVADDGTSVPASEVEGVPILGGMKDLPEIVRAQPTDEVVFAIGPREFPAIEEHLGLCQEMGLTSRLVLDLPRRLWTHQDVAWVDGMGVLSLDPVRRPPWTLAVKRALDLVGALAGLSLFAVAYLRYAPRIRRDSPGPVLFSQVRVGRNGRLFALYKFRTMYVDAEARREELGAANEMQGSIFKVRDDPRITPLGRWLRATHLDELPQFWSVLRGEMSLVGTRPPTLDEVECYRPHHRRRLSMKPGITGLWQLEGNERVSDFEEIVRLDCQYIDSWSIRLDLHILAKTVVKVLRPSGW